MGWLRMWWAITPWKVGSGGTSQQGLVGMRERVDTLGGVLRAGPHEGGFRVHAVLPLPDTTDEEPRA